MTEPTEQGYTAGPIHDPDFYRVPCVPAPATCPTCDPLDDSCPVYAGRASGCPTPTPVSDDGAAILDELSSHADEDRESEAYKEQAALCEAVSDAAVREALERLRSSDVGCTCACLPCTCGYEADLATLEAAIHQRDERIGELEGKE